MRIVPDGWRYATPPGLLAVLALPLAPVVAAAAAAAAGAIIWFFRDPPRSPATAGIVSPADGRVSVIRTEDDRVRVGVFMNVTDVHVNRTPVTGTVADVEHRPGAYRPAFTKDSDRNERVVLELDGPVSLRLELIAGWFARRITPYVAPGDGLDRGDPVGHIAFGSRVDVVFPPRYDAADIRVGIGDRVTAGETVIAPAEVSDAPD